MTTRNHTYINGNTVRKEEQRREYTPHIEDGRGKAYRREQDSAIRMDLPFLVLLTAAAVIALVICCRYLQVQSSITTSIKRIEAQEKILEELKNDNDALETRINSGINLNRVYDVATKELGMVYASQDQVIRYDKTESEYVRQYDDIPE